MTNDQIQMVQDVAHIKTRTDEIHTRLFGDGGLEKRVDSLEATRDKGHGVLWILSTISAFLGAAIVRFFTEGNK